MRERHASGCMYAPGAKPRISNHRLIRNVSVENVWMRKENEGGVEGIQLKITLTDPLSQEMVLMFSLGTNKLDRILYKYSSFIWTVNSQLLAPA